MEYPTDQYKKFFFDAEEACQGLDLRLSEKYSIKAIITAYHSNKRFDLDNCIKPTLDALQKILQFNDCNVTRIEANKEIIDKGNERTEIVLESNNHD